MVLDTIKSCIQRSKMQPLDNLLPSIEYPAQVVKGLLDSITIKDVDTAQIPALLKASCSHLDTIRRRLHDLCQNVPKDSSVLSQLDALKTRLHDDEEFTLQKLTAQLADLQKSADPDQSSPASIVLLECRALAEAAMQQHQSGAKFCRSAIQTPGIDPLQQWNLACLEAQLIGDYGREFADESALQSAIELLRTQVLPLAQASGLQDNLAIGYETLGTFLGVVGQRRSGTRYLEESIHAFRKALEHCDATHTPSIWTSAQNGLGNALGALGQRQSDDDLCNMSIAAFEQALEFRSEEKTPDEWASTLNNMAAVLHSLGRKNQDPKILKRAVDAYKKVLRVWTKTRIPIDWATTMFNLGTALGTLGEHRRGPRTLEQAVAAYNSALSIRTLEWLPEQWAITHNNLGTALQKLAEHQQSPELLQKAVESYENTLSVWTRNMMPMRWAMAMANLGVARYQLAAMERDIESAGRAVDEIKSAVGIFRDASHAKYTELGEEQLARARQLLTQLTTTHASGGQ